LAVIITETVEEYFLKKSTTELWRNVYKACEAETCDGKEFFCKTAKYSGLSEQDGDVERGAESAEISWNQNLVGILIDWRLIKCWYFSLKILTVISIDYSFFNFLFY